MYTAQDVARFCEVDLKTVHHWADRGKIPHRRTAGRHLRFRRNEVIAFLRAHGYPIPDAVARSHPTVFFAIPQSDGLAFSADDVAKRLGSRFFVERHASAMGAVARLVAGEPDAIVLSLDDPALAGVAGLAVLRALKADPALAWIVIVAIGRTDDVVAARDAGADIALAVNDATRLTAELTAALAIG